MLVSIQGCFQDRISKVAAGLYRQPPAAQPLGGGVPGARVAVPAGGGEAPGPARALRPHRPPVPGAARSASPRCARCPGSAVPGRTAAAGNYSLPLRALCVSAGLPGGRESRLPLWPGTGEVGVIWK